MKKRVFLYFLLLFASLLVYNPISIQAAGHHQVELMINGSVEVPEVPAMINNGRTLVPLRFISEKMGAHVEWLPQTKEIKIYKGERLVELQLGSNQIKMNGVSAEMDVAPYLEKERTLVPIRFVSNYLGLNVGWEETERTVIVSEPIHVYVDGKPFTEENNTLRYKEQIYLPIFKLAHLLQVEVKKELDTNTYSFIPKRNNEKQQGVQISSFAGQENNEGQAVELANSDEKRTLPNNEIIIVDGVKMAPFEWVDSLLGTASTWDMEKNIVYINKQAETYNPENNEVVNSLPKLIDYTVEENKFRFELTEHDVEAQHFFLNNPQRLVVDLPHTLLGGNLMNSYNTGGYVVPVEHEVVEQIRISQFSSSPYTVRLVFDLKQRVDVSFQQVNNHLEIALSKRVPLIVVDAGHGGSDPGALGQFSQEKQVTLGITHKLLHLLENDADVKVLATRIDDSYPTLDDRVYLANQNDADLFISVHANANNNKAIGGTETYIYLNVDDTFGKIVHKHLAEATGLLDRGLKQANFKVIRETNMPAVLVEVAFISNAYEEKLLNDPAFQERVANALYNAIKEYEKGK